MKTMIRAIRAWCALALCLCATGLSQAQVTVSYTGPPVAIPDNIPAGVNITLPVAGVGTISDVNFRLDTGGFCNATVGNTNAAMDHTFVGDLRFRLTSPVGTSVVVFDRHGGTRENYCNTVIDDEGRYVLGVDVPPTITGSSMAGAFSADAPLAAFDGQNANGTWVLNVSDNATIDTGSLRRFSLVFNSTAPTALMYGYNFSGDRLLSFTADRPSLLLTDVAITGIAANEDLTGMEFRPSDGLLYAMGENFTTSRLLRINLDTGAATSVSATTIASTTGVFFGFDFNPVVDRIRVVDDSDNNRRFNPNDGAVAGTDTNLAYAAGDPGAGANPSVVHAAYTNSFAGATQTALYGIDVARDSLVTIGGLNGVPSPNTGQLTTVGVLGVDATSFGGFDIQPRTNLAYAALRVAVVSVLHAINLNTGAATVIGPIGSGTTIDGLAIRDGRAELFVHGFEDP